MQVLLDLSQSIKQLLCLHSGKDGLQQITFATFSAIIIVTARNEIARNEAHGLAVPQEQHLGGWPIEGQLT